MDCIDVLKKVILSFHLEKATFKLFDHTVGQNWREKYGTNSQKLHHLNEGLIQHTPFAEWLVAGEQIIDNLFDPKSYVISEGHVISMSSKIKIASGETRHLAIMNLHPEGHISYDKLVKMIEIVTENMPGYLLESGRYYHFYGHMLLDEEQWLRFMAQFLMPTILVSPRYIGHCMYRGYAALRLTTDKTYKPLLPIVCSQVGQIAPIEGFTIFEKDEMLLQVERRTNDAK